MEKRLLWVARAVWLVLAFTTATELEDALDGWSRGPSMTLGVLAWSLWAAGLLSLLAPRPWGFTVLRVAVTAAFGSAVVAAGATDASRSVPAILVTLVAAGVVTGAAVAHACAQGSWYGYERRFPLRAPFALLVGGIPVVAALIAIGAGAGVVLLADGRVAQGVVALVVGLPFAAVLARALHGLSTRWLVTVPAGFVVVDPLSLVDPVLVPDSAIDEIVAAPVRVDERALDLRLGTAPGSLMLRTSAARPVPRRTGRKETTAVETDRILFTPVRPSWFLAALSERPRVRE